MATKISNTLFALTFPGTILYYVATSQHLFPPINAGFFGLMCGLSLITVFPLYIFDTFRLGKIQSTDCAFFLFLIFFALIVAWHGTQTSDKSLMTWHLTSIAQSIAVFILCKKTFTTQENYSKLIALFWLASSACILIFSEGGRFALRETSGDVGVIPSYQTFALCYMITTIYIVTKISWRHIRLTIHIIALTCLYINSARSEFAGYAFFAALLEFLSYKKKSTPIFLAIVAAGFTFTAITSDVVKLPQSRITALADLQNDNSSNVRDRISREGIDKILESPLTGAYGQYEEGEYIHNIMSAWQETGLIGALFFIILIGAPALKGIVDLFSGESRHISMVGLSLILTTILLLIAGKYFTYLLVPAALAICSASKQKQL